jgi:hypothetical protein
VAAGAIVLLSSHLLKESLTSIAQSGRHTTVADDLLLLAFTVEFIGTLGIAPGVISLQTDKRRRPNEQVQDEDRPPFSALVEEERMRGLHCGVAG